MKDVRIVRPYAGSACRAAAGSRRRRRRGLAWSAPPALTAERGNGEHTAGGGGPLLLDVPAVDSALLLGEAPSQPCAPAEGDSTLAMTCCRCGARAVLSLHGEDKCLSCGWEPPPPTELVPVASRRFDVDARMIRRWIDAGVVRGAMPTGSGRVRQFDVVSVADYIAARWTAPRTCEQCGGEIAPAGVQRASRVNRRWCTTGCKSDYHHAARDRSRAAA